MVYKNILPLILKLKTRNKTKTFDFCSLKKKGAVNFIYNRNRNTHIFNVNLFIHMH